MTNEDLIEFLNDLVIKFKSKEEFYNQISNEFRRMGKHSMKNFYLGKAEAVIEIRKYLIEIINSLEKNRGDE